ncbi:MAG TPA: ParB/RepB/Spo0J family partition protein [bacterium]|nr:ParB/RepB/Spo0J family partition protein [bacterium]
MQLKRGLGRGLESLIPPPIESEGGASKKFRMIPVDSIMPNRLQPRTVFDEEKIKELSASIREQGIIQPLAVSSLSDGRYELIAGERRLRASKLAGLSEVPVFIKDVDSEQMLALSLLENIQREDLNPIEEARAYQELIAQFGYTQEDVAEKLGKSRAAVANSIRLLKLPHVVQEDIANERYSAGHARALLSLPTLHDQLKMRERIMREMPTVRDVEVMVHDYSTGAKKRQKKKDRSLSPHLTDLVEKMKQALGTKVQLHQQGGGGRLVIGYYNAQDLDRIYRNIVR